jgi:hypothetical protein
MRARYWLLVLYPVLGVGLSLATGWPTGSEPATAARLRAPETMGVLGYQPELYLITIRRDTEQDARAKLVAKAAAAS